MLLFFIRIPIGGGLDGITDGNGEFNTAVKAWEEVVPLEPSRAFHLGGFGVEKTDQAWGKTGGGDLTSASVLGLVLRCPSLGYPYRFQGFEGPAPDEPPAAYFGCRQTGRRYR